MDADVDRKEVDFEVNVDGGKYMIRIFKGIGWEVLRHGELWISHLDVVTLRGANCWFSMAHELHAYHSGKGSAPAKLPLAIAKETVVRAGLPKGDDGKTPLPVPVNIVEVLIAQALTRDREMGPIDADSITNLVVDPLITDADDSSTSFTTKHLRSFVKHAVKIGVVTAQSRGARILPALSEDDYDEALAASHEAFMSVLKDKGFLK